MRYITSGRQPVSAPGKEYSSAVGRSEKGRRGVRLEKKIAVPRERRAADTSAMRAAWRSGATDRLVAMAN